MAKKHFQMVLKIILHYCLANSWREKQKGDGEGRDGLDATHCCPQPKAWW